MKHTFLVATALTGVLALACKSTSNGSAQMAMDEQAAQAKWMEFATPSHGHELLDDHVGSWNAKVRMFQPDGKLMEESNGACECRWLFDGRYVEEVMNGSMMGQPFSGRGLTGYDNMKHAYVGTWVDNMTTGIMTAEGKYDAKTRTFAYTTEMPNMMTGQYAPARYTVQTTDRDHHTMTMYAEGPSGHEFKCMEILYTRRR